MKTNKPLCSCGDCESVVQRALAYLEKATKDGDCVYMAAMVGQAIANIATSAACTITLNGADPHKMDEVMAAMGGAAAEVEMLANVHQAIQSHFASSPAFLKQAVRCVEVGIKAKEADRDAVKADKPIPGGPEVKL